MEVAESTYETVYEAFSAYCIKRIDRLTELFDDRTPETHTLPAAHLEGLLFYYSLFIYSLKYSLTDKLIQQLAAEKILKSAPDQLPVIQPLFALVDTTLDQYLKEHPATSANDIRIIISKLADVMFLGLKEGDDRQVCRLRGESEEQKTIIHDIRGTKGIIIGAAMLSASVSVRADREQFIHIIQRNLIKLTAFYHLLSEEK